MSTDYVIHHNQKNCTDPDCSKQHEHVKYSTLQSGIPCGIETCVRIAYQGRYCSQFHTPQRLIPYVQREKPIEDA